MNIHVKKVASYVTTLILIIVALVPLLVFVELDLNATWQSLPGVLTFLGKVTSLVGLSLFALTMLLSSRYVWLDRLFNGLPQALSVHRWFGIFSFTFILMHPLLLAFSYLPFSPAASLSLFTNFSDTAYTLGYISIILFMVLIVLTLFIRLKYELLKSLHSWLAIPLMLGGMHALLISSDVSSTGWLTAYYIVLITICVSAYLVRIALISWGVKARPFSVAGIDHPSENTTRVTLKPLVGNFKFSPGQFAFVRFLSIDKTEEHPFSLASDPQDSTIQFVAKNLGDFTGKLSNIPKGSIAYVDGPYGSFGATARDNRKQIWIAGGIGITPFLSMAKSLLNGHPIQKVDLFYVAAQEKDFVDLSVLGNISKKVNDFKVYPFASETEGMFSVERMNIDERDFNKHDYFICGPPSLVKSLVEQLRRRRVSNSQIHLEAFSLL